MGYNVPWCEDNQETDLETGGIKWAPYMLAGSLPSGAPGRKRFAEWPGKGRSLPKTKPNGMSAHITRAWLEQWEAQHGQFQPGDVPIWYSEYDDMHYQPFPNGDRFQNRMLWAPLIAKSAPGWVAADPDAMELLQERGVVHVATDAPSFGWTEGGQPTHVAGLKYGMSWSEGAVNCGSPPLPGAFFVTAPQKLANQAAGLTRAFAIKPAGVAGVAASPPLVLE